MTLGIKYIDTTTSKGWENAIEFEKNNPDWKLITTRIALTWIFEKEMEEVSNCCSAKIIPETDFCSDCLEHCETITI